MSLAVYTHNIYTCTVETYPWSFFNIRWSGAAAGVHRRFNQESWKLLSILCYICVHIWELEWSKHPKISLWITQFKCRPAVLSYLKFECCAFQLELLKMSRSSSLKFFYLPKFIGNKFQLCFWCCHFVIGFYQFQNWQGTKCKLWD